jgi:hypothetical protein
VARIARLIRGQLVALDTAAFIYYLEENPVYLPVADELFEAIDRRETRGMTGVLTLLEVMAKPPGEGGNDIADSYRRPNR